MTALLVRVYASGMTPTLRRNLQQLNGQEYKILRHFYSELKHILDPHPGKVFVTLGTLEDWLQYHKTNPTDEGVEYIFIDVDQPWKD